MPCEAVSVVSLMMITVGYNEPPVTQSLIFIIDLIVMAFSIDLPLKEVIHSFLALLHSLVKS